MGTFLKQIKFRKGSEKKISWHRLRRALKYNGRIYVGDRIPPRGRNRVNGIICCPSEKEELPSLPFHEIRLLVRPKLSLFHAENLWAMMTGIRDRVELVTGYLASLRFLIRSLLLRLLNRSSR